MLYSYGQVLSPFNVALALSIGRIHSFEEQVIGLFFGLIYSVLVFVNVVLNFSCASSPVLPICNIRLSYDTRML